ncbi:hypothetical protein L210DRAFT_2704400 [Boletus edulis BED1]|uniref:Uncharacterized protein n=1 Tax=Boletus edulis BED1 TaxID=1328754 RepID=A0AAD4BAM2_BOLED|nr:hypothetical protein L210DRAFT_2704400 [Boletus edulis BED1]
MRCLRAPSNLIKNSATPPTQTSESVYAPPPGSLEAYAPRHCLIAKVRRSREVLLGHNIHWAGCRLNSTDLMSRADDRTHIPESVLLICNVLTERVVHWKQTVPVRPATNTHGR